MVKRTFVILLSGILATAALSFRATHAQTGQNSQTGEAARAAVARLGVGEEARAEIKLRDQRKLKGYVSATGADSFTLTDRKTGTSQTIAYADVDNVKRTRNGLKPVTWAIIGGAAAAALIVGFTVIKPVLCDGGAGC